MVDIYLKGTVKKDGYNKTIEIVNFKAGVILKDKGGIFIIISNKEVTNKMIKCFDVEYKNESREV